VSGIRSLLMISGVPVVTAPAEIDVTTAEQLRMVLLSSAARRHPAVVVDMTHPLVRQPGRGPGPQARRRDRAIAPAVRWAPRGPASEEWGVS
jgi:hypothetical protein